MTLAPHSRKKICYYYDSKYLLFIIFLLFSHENHLNFHLLRPVDNETSKMAALRKKYLKNVIFSCVRVSTERFKLVLSGY